MKEFLSESTYGRIADEDMEVLATLDSRGLLIGGQESAAEYAERLRSFERNLNTMETSLSEKGVYDSEGITVRPEDRIGSDRFDAISFQTKDLYGFSIDWVPGFYVDPSCSFLFGGCSFCQYPDFFSLFIIRRSFKTQSRWLIYDRDELLSHELCHVARIGLESEQFEETFAYQTSGSRFRRLIGGMFCRQSDTFMFLGVSLLFLLARVMQVLVYPKLPMYPFALLLVGWIGWLCIRHCFTMNIWKGALRSLEKRYGDAGRKVLFRCTDRELSELSSLGSMADVSDWVERRAVKSLRWRVIEHRFGKGTVTLRNNVEENAE